MCECVYVVCVRARVCVCACVCARMVCVFTARRCAGPLLQLRVCVCACMRVRAKRANTHTCTYTPRTVGHISRECPKVCVCDVFMWCVVVCLCCLCHRHTHTHTRARTHTPARAHTHTTTTTHSQARKIVINAARPVILLGYSAYLVLIIK